MEVRGQNMKHLSATYKTGMYTGERKYFSQHCKVARKSADHLATKCNRMLGYDYMRRHNEVVKCIHILLCNKRDFNNGKKLRTLSVQEIIENENAKIKVDTTIRIENPE